ncbi:MAG: type II toxin-antitoxin system Phd/YefM family antitoxin [Rhodocyclaceae bacterium]|nr:type II toxin-antitoxin system Phd/YefM family antitoxin [Rhodocyclaceae bacterium]
MSTVSAADANRHFSRLLREVAAGEPVTIVSRGKPVAVMVSPEFVTTRGRATARDALLQRLRQQQPAGARDWVREDLYRDEP